MGLLPEQWVNQTNDEAFNAKFAKFQYPARAFTLHRLQHAARPLQG